MILTTRLLILSVLSRVLGLELYVVAIDGIQTAAIRHTLKAVVMPKIEEFKPLEEVDLELPLRSMKGNKR